MTKNRIHTPWGWSQETQELDNGIWRVFTASHGGLKMSRERWEELPDLVRDSFITPTFAEEDCEEPIAMTLLNLGNGPLPGAGHPGSGRFPRYAPALPYLRAAAPGPHYHVIAYGGRLRNGPVRAVRHPHPGRVLRGRRRDGAGLREDGNCRVQPGAPALPHLKNTAEWAKPSLKR